MTRWLKQHPYGVFVAGLGFGLVLGVGMLIGSLATRVADQGGGVTFPAVPLHASATDSGETFAMATGLITDGVEGVFFLDFLTGDLQCWVLNNRTGQMGGHFRHNISGDLGIIQGKKPRFLMVTGVAPIVRASSAVRPADSIVYVADATSGNFAAYALPFNRNAFNSNAPQIMPMRLIGKGSARNIELRQ